MRKSKRSVSYTHLDVYKRQVFINAAEEAAAVVFLFLVGELLEGVAAGKARASIQSLVKLVPKTAWLEEDGQTREVPAESVVVLSLIHI